MKWFGNKRIQSKAIARRSRDKSRSEGRLGHNTQTINTRGVHDGLLNGDNLGQKGKGSGFKYLR